MPEKIQLPPFRALLAFRAAATHDRMADAAVTLGVTESAVSHQVRQLETLLHTRLFDRSSGRLVLTETGRRYLARIDPALREIQSATAAVLPEGGRSVVRVTMPTSLAAVWLMPRMGAFQRDNPGIDLQLVPTTRVIDLARDQVDVAIRYGKGAWSGVEAEFLFHDLATPVAAPGYLPEGSAPTAELLARVRLLVNRAVPDEWEEWARAHDLAPPSMADALVFDATEQVLQVAAAGQGLAIGRSPYRDALMASGALVAPFGAAGPTEAAYHLCRSAGHDPRAPVRRVLRWLADQGAELRAAQEMAAGT